MPDLDPRTYIILALIGALVAIVAFVGPVREWVGGLLLAVGAWLAGRRATQKASGGGSDEPKAEPVDVADEADSATDTATDDEQNPSAEDVAKDINDITSEVN
ncbi:MAG: hypothetical protein ABEN55_13545 [Bradymonadaceae bacterium]